MSQDKLSTKTRGQRTKIDDKLDDLKHSDILLPPDTNTTSTLEVVPIHDNVYEQIQGNHNP